MNRLVYTAYVVLDRLSLSICETSCGPQGRSFSVHMGANALGEVTFSEWYYPSIGVNGKNVFVWGGTRLFRLQPGTAPSRADIDDQIHFVYAAGEFFVIVCETSIRVFSVGLEEVSRRDTTDVLGGSYWVGSVLHVHSESGEIRVLIEGSQLRFLGSDSQSNADENP